MTWKGTDNGSFLGAGPRGSHGGAGSSGESGGPGSIGSVTYIIGAGGIYSTATGGTYPISGTGLTIDPGHGHGMATLSPIEEKKNVEAAGWRNRFIHSDRKRSGVALPR